MPADAEEIRALVTTIVEQCWVDGAGLERMRGLVATGYVHHTAFGDWSFDQFVAGVGWIDERIGDRGYRVEHVVVEGDLAAAFLRYRGTRREDRSAVDGRGAYHCRILDGRVVEDWDVFFPAG
ncbi:MAG TPA: nuclear transport factor 2 family protein [Thermoleophilia bacterium]|nr:nuclear transport factor 2 family protein [Thermoleophilia bacterium]